MTISTQIYINKGPLSKFQSGDPYNLNSPLVPERHNQIKGTLYPTFPDSHTILMIPE